MLFSKLRTRMIAHIVWVTTAIVLLSFFIAYRMHQVSIKNHLRSDAEEAGHIVENLLVKMMVNESPELLNNLLPELSRLHHIREIRILDDGGRIVFSSNPAEKDSLFDISQILEFVDDTPDILSYDVVEGKNTSFVKFRKLENKPQCHECHDPARRINGLLYIKTSDELGLHTLRRETVALSVLALGVILVLSLATYSLFIRSVDRPVRELQRAIQAYEAGNFSYRLPATGKDELGSLAAGLNSMAAKLEQARTHLMEQHRQQIKTTESLAKMGEIAASLAHEIKNPISGIVFAINSILRDLSRDDKRREIFEEIARQANQVEQNLEALLAFARQSRMERFPTDVNEIIERIVLFIRQQPDMKNIRILSKLDPELPEILVDPKQIEQVLLNLIINAVQAMPDGGELTLETRLEAKQHRVRIAVHDTGTGIPREKQDRVFQPFFTTKVKGTGLGLTLCKEIVLRHGGSISFDSRPGEGTVFYVELPIGKLESL